jgi:hypothetical protein
MWAQPGFVTEELSQVIIDFGPFFRYVRRGFRSAVPAVEEFPAYQNFQPNPVNAVATFFLELVLAVVFTVGAIVNALIQIAGVALVVALCTKQGQAFFWELVFGTNQESTAPLALPWKLE